MIPDIYVISLKLSMSRRQYIQRQLKDGNIPFHFFDAIDGRINLGEMGTLYDEKLRIKRRGAPLSLGQLGCFASHHALWKLCASIGRPIIILEDDVNIDASLLKKFCDQCITLPQTAECIRLFENKTRNHIGIPDFKTSSFTLYKYTKGPMSGMGYFLRPSGAQKLLAQVSPVFLPMDIYMDRFWIHGVESHGIRPACVTHRGAFESTIGYSKEKKKRNAITKLLRETFNLTEKTRRLIHNIKFMLNRFYKKRGI